MATLSELQAQLEALKKARGRGVLRVSTATGTIEYRSMDDIMAAIAAVEGEIAALDGSTPVRQIYVTAEKGL